MDDLHARERIAHAHHEDPIVNALNRVLDMHEKTLAMFDRYLNPLPQPEDAPAPTDADEIFDDPLTLEQPWWLQVEYDDMAPPPVHQPVGTLKPGERIHPDLPRPDEQPPRVPDEG